MALDVIDVTAAAVSALVAGAYVCRLDMMQIRTARAGVILLHLLGLGVALWVLAWAMDGRTPGVPGLVGLAASACWIVATWPHWRHGMPTWARRRARREGDHA